MTFFLMRGFQLFYGLDAGERRTNHFAEDVLQEFLCLFARARPS